MGARVRVSWGVKGWVREHRPLITEGYGQSGLGLFIFLKKTKGVNPKHPTLKKNSPILSMLAINRNHMFCALTIDVWVISCVFSRSNKYTLSE